MCFIVFVYCSFLDCAGVFLIIMGSWVDSCFSYVFVLMIQHDVCLCTQKPVVYNICVLKTERVQEH